MIPEEGSKCCVQRGVAALGVRNRYGHFVAGNGCSVWGEKHLLRFTTRYEDLSVDHQWDQKVLSLTDVGPEPFRKAPTTKCTSMKADQHIVSFSIRSSSVWSHRNSSIAYLQFFNRKGVGTVSYILSKRTRKHILQLRSTVEAPPRG